MANFSGTLSQSFQTQLNWKQNKIEMSINHFQENNFRDSRAIKYIFKSKWGVLAKRRNNCIMHSKKRSD